jgi:hypothetical protein
VVSALDRESRFRSGSEVIKAAILDCYSAAQHYRYVVLDVPRSDVMLGALEKASRIVIVGNQELDHAGVDTDRGRETSAANREKDPARSWSRRVPAPSAGMAERHGGTSSSNSNAWVLL